MSFKSLIIGVPEYNDSSITPLPFVKNDIRLFKSTIKNHLNIEDENIAVLGEDPSECTWSNVLREFKKFSHNSNEDDTVIIYYSGHGTSFEGDGYLICKDTERDFINRTAISISELSNTINTTPAKNKLIFLDSCYSGVNLGKSNDAKFVIEKISDLQSEGWSILSSCKGNELSYALKDGTASIYTHFLCEALSGKAISNGDDKLGLSDINKYVQKKVTNYAINHHSASQTPTLKSERVGNLEFKISFEKEDGKENDPPNFQLIPNIYKNITFQYEYIAPTTKTTYNLNMGDYNPNNLNAGFGVKNKTELSSHERRSKTTRKQKKVLNELNTAFLRFIEPSDIDKKSRTELNYPFGKLVINNHETSFDLELTINNSEKSEIIDLLNFLDDQEVIKWDKLFFPTQDSLDFDCVKNVCEQNNYSIIEFDVVANTMVINLTVESENNLLLKIKNSSEKSEFTFYEKEELRENFLETLPIFQITGNFKDC